MSILEGGGVQSGVITGSGHVAPPLTMWGSLKCPPPHPLSHPHLSMCHTNSLAIFFLSLPACSHLTTSVWSTSHGTCDRTFQSTCTSNYWSQPVLIFGTCWEPHNLFLVRGQRRALPWGSSQEVEVNADAEGFAHTWRKHQPCIYN